MKKFISILILSLSFVLFAGEYAHHGMYVKCARCAELYNTNKTVARNVAWRTLEYKKENGKVYAKYKCAGGHAYWAELK